MLATAFRPDAIPAPVPLRTQDVLEGLAVPVTVLHANRDQEIAASARGGMVCYQIMQGCVRTVSMMEDGRRQIGEFLFKGDLLDVDEVFGAEAVTDAVLRRIPVAVLEDRAATDPGFAHRLRTHSVRQLRAARNRMLLLGRKTATERVASFLLEMESRLGLAPDGAMSLPMSRTDIADYLGLTTETVCRTLTDLRHAGIIQAQRASIAVKDHAGLVRAAGEWMN